LSGTVSRVSPKFVWIDIIGAGDVSCIHQKRNHNVFLVKAVVGSEITICNNIVVDRT
jgi:hypothetical protein